MSNRPSVNGQRTAGTPTAARAILRIEEARTELASVAADTLVAGDDQPAGCVTLHRLALIIAAAGELLPLALLLALGSEIAVAVGSTTSAFGFTRMLTLVAPAVGAGAGSFAVRRLRRHAWGACGGLLAAAAGLVVAALGTSVAQIGAGIVLSAAGFGAARSIASAMLYEHSEVARRPHALATMRATSFALPLSAVVFVAVSPGSWRAHLLAIGAVHLVVAVWSVGVPNARYGQRDASRARLLVNDRFDGEGVSTAEASQLTAGESFRRVLSAPSVRAALVGSLAVGSCLAPLLLLVPVALKESFSVVASTRPIVTTALVGVAAVGAVCAGRAALDARALLPFHLRRLALAAFITAVAVAVLLPGGSLALAVIAVAAFAGVAGAYDVALLRVAGVCTLPALRPHLFSLATAAFAVGASQGVAFVNSMEGRYGLTVASVAVASLLAWVPAVARRAASTFDQELDDIAGELVEDQVVRVLRYQRTPIPLLACRHIDFSYGQLQVLFDVSFSVEEGQMVALLGTNGAGKSTLLRAISGVGRPTRGHVRYDGEDITYHDPQRRATEGVVQIPGGKATFRQMSVLDNLRAYGYTLGRNRRLLETRIDDVFAQFPRLAERRAQPAGTLSGGEAQMLALGKAMLLRPRLLLIDELSLGLAPKVVGELLDLVRRINADGTAVVLVEQSVNIALSLVDHAYFMEKGEIRFDGVASELLDRDDLLRSVFLAGAAKGLA